MDSTAKYTEDEKIAWVTVARTQGLVCLVCGEPPELSWREEFFGTGLCLACTSELERSDLDRECASPSLA